MKSNIELDVATKYSAGHELKCLEDVILEKNEMKVIETGITLNIPKNYYFQIAPKSKHSLYGIQVLAGVVDSDYTGTIKVILLNSGKSSYKIEKGKSIAQGILLRYYHLSNCNYIHNENFLHEGFGSSKS